MLQGIPKRLKHFYVIANYLICILIKKSLFVTIVGRENQNYPKAILCDKYHKQLSNLNSTCI